MSSGQRRSTRGAVKRKCSQDISKTNSRPKEPKITNTTIQETLDLVIEDTQSEVPRTILSRCGKVLCIHLTNFMCHSNLRFDLHRNVNFLVGSNGSGKSAILAALVIGLGCKARDTNRTTSLKEFIKNGESSAKIEISISNDGPEGFEQEIYGNSITIIRNITQSNSTFTIKSEMGQTISKKLDELHRILLFHNIQVENPLFVLNQDSAREFLKDLEPRKNYELFQKATQIELIKEKLIDCREKYQELAYHLKCFEEKIDNNKHEIKGLQKKLDLMRSIEILKNNIANLELELKWLKVSQFENELGILIGDMEQLVETRTALIATIQNKERNDEELTRKFRDLESQVTEKNSYYRQLNNEYQAIKTKDMKLNDHCCSLTTFRDDYARRIVFLTQQIEELQNNIKQSTQGNIDEMNNLRQQHQNSLMEFEKQLSDNKAIIQSIQQELNIFYSTKLQIGQKKTELNSKKDELEHKIRRLQSSITIMNESSKNPTSVFGEYVVNFLAEIEFAYKQGKFSQRPRGPIGRYIEVPNDKYRDIIESHIGALLHGFIVNTKEDRFILEAILEQKFPNYRPIIITTKFLEKVYDVSKGCVVATRYTRLLMDEVKCSDPVVMNCLIDRKQIETILLTEQKEVAEHCTATLENVPKNLLKVIVPNLKIEYYPEPSYRMYSIKIRQARFIQVNVKDRIGQLELEKNKRIMEYEKLLSDIKSLTPQIQEISINIKEKSSEVERLQLTEHELNEQITEIKNYEYLDFEAESVMQKEIEILEIQKREFQEKLENKAKELTESEAKKVSIAEEINEKKRDMEQVRIDIETGQKDAENAKIEIRNIADQFETNQVKIKEITKNIKQQEAEKNIKIERLSVMTKEAEKMGERIDTAYTENEILDNIDSLKSQLKQRAKMTVDPVAIEEAITEKRHTLEADQSSYDIIHSSINLLVLSLKSRRNNIMQLKNHLSICFKFAFEKILKVRDITGKAELDQKEKVLNISVIPRDSHIENAVSNTKSLSGGERSYTTVAMLVALWACVDHPFFFLDEYDVFTDVVTREFMTRLLITHGLNHPDRQFVFLTPQNMNLSSQHSIKIHRLPEPDRG